MVFKFLRLYYPDIFIIIIVIPHQVLLCMYVTAESILIVLNFLLFLAFLLLLNLLKQIE